MDAKRTLTLMVRAAREAQKFDSMLSANGYDNNPYFKIYGDIVDAVYAFLGEDTTSLDESVTGMVMSSNDLTEEQCVEILLNKYEGEAEQRHDIP